MEARRWSECEDFDDEETDMYCEQDAYTPLDFESEVEWPEVSEEELTPEQESEFLHTLWDIMRGFVDMGFGEAALSRILPSLLGEAWDSAELDVVSEDELRAAIQRMAAERDANGDKATASDMARDIAALISDKE